MVYVFTWIGSTIQRTKNWNQVYQRCLLPKVDIKTFGLYHLFSTLLSFAMMRWVYQSPIKRATNYHAHDFCSEHWSSTSMSDKKKSSTLKFIGENREVLVSWMKSQLQADPTGKDKFVMMDSTHVGKFGHQC